MIIGNGLNPYVLSDENNDMPLTYSLSNAYPNPFNPTTTINYNIGFEGHVSITVYDLSGRVVDNLVDGYKNEGNHEVTWSADMHPSGVYFVRLNVNGYTDTQKLMLIK